MFTIAGFNETVWGSVEYKNKRGAFEWSYSVIIYWWEIKYAIGRAWKFHLKANSDANVTKLNVASFIIQTIFNAFCKYGLYFALKKKT